MNSTDPVLVDRASRLMTFLARAQAMKSRPVLDISQYERDGIVLWWQSLPEHETLQLAGENDRAELTADDSAILTCRRVSLTEPPRPPDELTPWVDGVLNDPHHEPRLRQHILVDRHDLAAPAADPGATGLDAIEPDAGVPGSGAPAVDTVEASDRTRAAFTEWLHLWRVWAEQTVGLLPVKKLYDRLFEMNVLAAGSSEQYELCLGTGLLAWRPEGHEPLRRHVFTQPLASTIDETTGTIELRLDDAVAGLRVELDMIDPSLVAMSSMVNHLERQAHAFEGHPLDESELVPMFRSLVNSLHAEGRYDPRLESIAASSTPVLAWAPAVMLRKRPQTGLVRSFETIARQIEEKGSVPAGLLPLVDPNSRPPVISDSEPGALIRTDMDVLTPLPLNDVQLRILERVDHHAQTLVQGPPGTGKTHTAAALLSHLLAQGKRVLVTAHTDRALAEVRDKLPSRIKPLAVSVIGASRSDMAELKTAVETIARESSERDPADGERIVQQALEQIGVLRAERDRELAALRAAREAEVIVHTVRGYEGTLAVIARQLAADASRHDWIDDHAPASATCGTPLSDADAARWLELLNDGELDSEPTVQGMLPGVDELPDPAEIARIADDIATAARALNACPLPGDHPVVTALLPLTEEQRTAVVQRIEQTRRVLVEAAVGSVPDISQAAAAALHNDLAAWRTRLERMHETLAEADAALAQLPPGSQVVVQMEPGTAHALALALLNDKASENLRTNADGSPKTGMFTPGIVKQCAPLFAHVRVNGMPPTSRAQLSMLLAWLDAARLLHLLDGSWSVPPRLHPSLHEQAAWHRHLLGQLQRAIDTDVAMFRAEGTLKTLNVPTPDWTTPSSLDTYQLALETVAASSSLAAARDALEENRTRINKVLADQPRATAQSLLDPLAQLDVDRYREAIGRLTMQNNLTARRRERHGLTERVRSALPTLAEAVTVEPANPRWQAALSQFEAACAWHDARAWLASHTSGRNTTGQGRISQLEEQLRQQVETLAAARAWNHAVAPERLTGSARADLTLYSQLVRRLGKGTGKYADRRRAEIRQAMDRCRPAVPVWIMPIYRVAEQLDMSENMFDVVLVDEASQAGLEATLLQYLAPRIVVIGDDKQVSPAAVGLDHQQMHRLADQYLHDDRYKSSWQDPRRSLFDEAKMRFGGQLTLVEHRRCVPEIIEFSNQIAYEPDGVRLEPVRQFGSSRLAPFRLTHTAHGTVRAASNINDVEAEALVDALVGAAGDPAYAGRTMGVISLVGKDQAKYIETLLAQRLPAEEWSRLQLRCGDAADFQGSERDVMFLSMVSARSEDRRLAALTQESAVQRFNVAVSRARDQVWLFHSITVEQLPNAEDLRHRLLSYAAGIVAEAPQDAEQLPPMPEDQPVEPLRDVFAQKVFNRINDAGFLVRPREVVAGYTTDMVVIGQHSRLIVECEGSTWDGPAAYGRDLRAQRELERCGWPIQRIRESTFVADETAILTTLWQQLEELGIARLGEEITGEPSSVDLPTSVASSSSPPRMASDAGTLHESTPLRHNDPTEQELSISGPGMDVAELPSAPESVLDAVPEPLVGDAPLGPLDVATAFHALRQRLSTSEPTAPDATAQPGVTEIPTVGMPAPTGGPEALSSIPSHTRAQVTPPQRPRSTGGFHLPAYTSFGGTTIPLTYAERRQVADGLREIVAVEGPITGSRLFRVYARASGASRTGGEMRRNLIAAVRAASSSRLLICDNPMGDAAVINRTYRLEHQPHALPRLLGPRELDEVPPAEIAAVMNMLLQHHGRLPDEQLYRETLRALGRQSLTKPAHDQFQRVRLRLLGGAQHG